MYNPMHPGEVIQELYVEPSGMSINSLAKALGVTGPTISRLISGKSSISVEMAFRLERVLEGSAESWLQMQTNYDVWQAKQSEVFQDIQKLQKLVLLQLI